MDFSTLDPDVWMVQWIDSRGEIERQDASGNNLNGLREVFIDVVPYCPLFQQFMRLLPGLLLPQAQKIQIELIGEVFDSKRQAPFHYPVAAGDYYWDATDATLFSSLVPALQNAISSINAIVARLNAVVPGLNANDASIVSQVNSGIAAHIIAIGNQIINEVNAWVVTATNNALNYINAIFGNVDGNVNQSNALVSHLNSNVLGHATDSNHINSALATVSGSGPPGLQQGVEIPWSPQTFSGVGSNPYLLTGIDQSFSWPAMALTAVPWTALPNVATSNVVWIPVGSSAPVTVTPAEQAAILSGIAARTNDLNTKKNTKTTAVYGLTDIDDVINYDVTTGW
jgi:hypothetical protein